MTRGPSSVVGKRGGGSFKDLCRVPTMYMNVRFVVYFVLCVLRFLFGPRIRSDVRLCVFDVWRCRLCGAIENESESRRGLSCV